MKSDPASLVRIFEISYPGRVGINFLEQLLGNGLEIENNFRHLMF